MNTSFIVCELISYGPTRVASHQEICNYCHREVWVAPSTISIRKRAARDSFRIVAVCRDCALKYIPEFQEIVRNLQGKDSAGRKRVLEKYIHPEQKEDLDWT